MYGSLDGVERRIPGSVAFVGEIAQRWVTLSSMQTVSEHALYALYLKANYFFDVG